jgi:NAD-dependent DNA ligase
MLVNKEDNKTVKIKEIHGFFKTLEVEKLGEANIEKIINIGANSIPKILALKVEEFEKVENFGKKMATKVHDSIKEKIANASLVKIAGASNIFGRGFKEARVKLILDEYPDILTLHEEDKIKLEKVKKIDNIGEKTGKQFVDNISNFIKFLKDSNLEYKLTQQPQQPQQPQEQPQQPQQPQLLKDKTLLMSDFKSATLTKKELQEKIESIGGKVVNSFTNNIDILIVGSLDNESGKLKKVKDYNTKAEKKNSPLIEIITVDDFIKKYLN